MNKTIAKLTVRNVSNIRDLYLDFIFCNVLFVLNSEYLMICMDKNIYKVLLTQVTTEIMFF